MPNIEFRGYRMFIPIPQEPGYKTSYAWPVEHVTAVLPAFAIDRDEVIHVDTALQHRSNFYLRKTRHSMCVDVDKKPQQAKFHIKGG